MGRGIFWLLRKNWDEILFYVLNICSIFKMSFNPFFWESAFRNLDFRLNNLDLRMSFSSHSKIVILKSKIKISHLTDQVISISELKKLKAALFFLFIPNSAFGIPQSRCLNPTVPIRSIPWRNFELWMLNYEFIS